MEVTEDGSIGSCALLQVEEFSCSQMEEFLKPPHLSSVLICGVSDYTKDLNEIRST